jgi:Ca2+-binding RTX toxin-like protein
MKVGQFKQISGTDAAEDLIGTSGRDQLYGFGGNDRLYASGTAAAVKDLELAPSSDPNDNPGKLNLFVADYGWSHVSDGRMLEIDLHGGLLLA